MREIKIIHLVFSRSNFPLCVLIASFAFVGWDMSLAISVILPQLRSECIYSRSLNRLTETIVWYNIACVVTLDIVGRIRFNGSFLLYSRLFFARNFVVFSAIASHLVLDISSYFLVSFYRLTIVQLALITAYRDEHFIRLGNFTHGVPPCS